MNRVASSASLLMLLFLILSVFSSNVFAWSNGGYSDDPSNPDYGTHDWIAEHALDWLPEEEKGYILDNFAAYLYGTELPDNGIAPDGIGDTLKHHIYYWSNGSLQDDASAFRAYEEYNKTVDFLEVGDFESASKTAGIMSHYIVDVAVFGHVMGAATDWGTEDHHSDYESYVNQKTSTYDAEFNTYLTFDGELDVIPAYYAALTLAHDTTFDTDGDLTCEWMDQNYNWNDPQFKDRCGESLNLAANYLADVLHTLYLEIPSVHNIDTGLHYATIQEAIDAHETVKGHTILVDAGIFRENVIVNKSISLIGESKHNTIIDGNLTGIVVKVTADNVKITDLTIQKGGQYSPSCGIYVGKFNAGNNISYNIIADNLDAFTLDHSSDNIISGNNIVNSGGICLTYSSHNNIISKNNVRGESDRAGVYIHQSSNNFILKNNITSCLTGISVADSSDNTISGNNLINNTRKGLVFAFECSGNVFCDNNVIDNEYGVDLSKVSNNLFYHNNFINNTHQTDSRNWGVNVWDDGYPSGGNYWSDYGGTDSHRDAIGDTLYIIDGYNKDNYPLMGMFSDFDATSEHHVQTICNSTISDFYFNGTAICFNVTGESGTAGFCRTCIPTTLLNDAYRVFVNGTEILPPPEPLPCSNSTHSYLYFTYTHSTQDVVIIPEFPSTLIVPLLMALTLGMTVLLKKRRSTAPLLPSACTDSNCEKSSSDS